MPSHPHVALTTGTNDYAHGLDVVVEGEAVKVTDDADLRLVTDAFLAKYGAVWHFDVVDGTFRHNPKSCRPERSGRPTSFGWRPPGARLRQGPLQPDPLALHRLTPRRRQG